MLDEQEKPPSPAIPFLINRRLIVGGSDYKLHQQVATEKKQIRQPAIFWIFDR